MDNEETVCKQNNASNNFLTDTELDNLDIKELEIYFEALSDSSLED